MNFLDFPEELLLKIFSYLPITAVLTHKIVSKGLKKIMEKFIRSLFSDEKNRLLILSDNRYKMTDEYQCALEKLRKAEDRDRERAFLSGHLRSPLAMSVRVYICLTNEWY